MKICHVINTLNRGGAETHLLDLIKEQKNNGYSIDLIVIGPDNHNIISLDAEFLNIGIPIHRLKDSGNVKNDVVNTRRRPRDDANASSTAENLIHSCNDSPRIRFGTIDDHRASKGQFYANFSCKNGYCFF